MSFIDVQEVFDKSGVTTPYETFEADVSYELQRLELGGGSCAQKSKQYKRRLLICTHYSFSTEEQAKLELKLEKAVLLHK